MGKIETRSLGNVGSGGGGTWGSITGTLSNQTDLATALALKANLASPTFTGTVTLPIVTGASITDGNSLCAAGDTSKRVQWNCNSIPTTKIVTLLFSTGGGDITITMPDVTSTVATRAGTETLSNKTLTSPIINTGTIGTSLKFGNYNIQPGFSDAGNSSTAITLDFSTAGWIKTTLSGVTPVITLSNMVAGAGYLVQLTQDGTGSRIPSFSPSVDFGSLGTPTYTTTTTKSDYVNIFYDGTNYKCLAYVLNYT